MRGRDNAAKSVIGGPADRETSGIRAAGALAPVRERDSPFGSRLVGGWGPWLRLLPARWLVDGGAPWLGETCMRRGSVAGWLMSLGGPRKWMRLSTVCESGSWVGVSC
jgi:hypothetical protein